MLEAAPLPLASVPLVVEAAEPVLVPVELWSELPVTGCAYEGVLDWVASLPVLLVEDPVVPAADPLVSVEVDPVEVLGVVELAPLVAD